MLTREGQVQAVRFCLFLGHSGISQRIQGRLGRLQFLLHEGHLLGEAQLGVCITILFKLLILSNKDLDNLVGHYCRHLRVGVFHTHANELCITDRLNSDTTGQAAGAHLVLQVQRLQDSPQHRPHPYLLAIGAGQLVGSQYSSIFIGHVAACQIKA